MKKGIILIFLLTAAGFGIYLLNTVAPFVPIAGNSMEPELKRGSLILIESLSPPQVKEGDIIVFNVPPPMQEHYNYPPMVTHRVIEVNTEGGITFRTKGDNTSEDPFTVLASDLRGGVGKQIPYLGYGIFFLQSRQGFIFMIIALFLFGVYLYGSELGQANRSLQRGVFAPILEQNQELAQRQEESLQMSSKALEQFASAMSEYARHLASHTDAIKNLAGASQELRDIVGELASHLKKDSPPKSEPE